MSTTAQLNRLAILDDANMVAILLTEERHSTHLLSLINGHFAVFLTRNCIANHLISQMLHLTDLLGCYLAEVGEVKAQGYRVNIRALLLHMGAQYMAQCSMQEVSRSMVALSSMACFEINRGMQSSIDVAREF